MGGLQNITITEEAWDVSGSLGAYTLDIVEYDNVQRYVLAVDEGEMWWRQQWTYDGDQLYFCTVTFDSLSMEEALALEPADSSDLVTGCGGYAWPDLSPSA